MNTSTMRSACRIIMLVACVVGTVPVSASEVEPPKNKHYVFVYLGGFRSGETAAILDHSTGGFSFGAGWGWRFNRLLTLELDVNGSSTDYEPEPTSRSQLGNARACSASTLRSGCRKRPQRPSGRIPRPGMVNQEIPGENRAGLTLATNGVLGNLKIGRRLGRVRPEVGVGLGVGLLDVSLSDPASWFVEPLESQASVLRQVLAGIDIRLSRRSHLGIEYRQLSALRTITFDGEEIDGGGNSFVLAYRLGL